MSKEKDTLDCFIRMTESIQEVTNRNSVLLESIISDQKELKKLNSIIDELRDENERLKREAKGGEA